MKLELPIRLTYEPIRGGGWVDNFNLPPQVLDYEEHMVDNFLH